MPLHIPTFLVLFVISNALMALLILIAFRRRRDRSLDLWLWSLVSLAAGWGAMLLRDELPARLAAVLTTCGLTLGYALLMSALAAFYRVRLHYGWPYWPVVVAVLMVASIDAAPTRQAVGTVAVMLQLGLGAGFILTRRDQWIGLRAMMGGSALLVALVLLLRLAMLAVSPETATVLTASGPVQTAIFLVAFVCRFCFMFGFILLIEARHQQDLSRLATLDSLTEAYNRRTFFELAERELKRCERQHRPLAVMLLDLDHFKRINDTLGHLAGDAALIEVKQVADRCLRGQDLFARYGGEEFCILAPDTGLAGAVALAERLRKALAASPPPGGAGAVPLTASIGVAIRDGGAGAATVDTLIAAADDALYRAKARGRNRVEVADEALRRPVANDYPVDRSAPASLPA